MVWLSGEQLGRSCRINRRIVGFIFFIFYLFESAAFTDVAVGEDWFGAEVAGGWGAEGVDFSVGGRAVGGESHRLIFNSDFIKCLLRASDRDVDEVLFLFFHPGLGGIFARHPGVASE